MISAVKRAGEAKLGIPLRQSVPFGWGGSTETGAGKAEKLKVPLVLMLSKRDSPARSTDAGAQNVGGAKNEWRGSLELLGNGKDVETAAGNGAKRTRKQHSGDWQDLAGLVGPGRTMDLT